MSQFRLEKILAVLVLLTIVAIIGEKSILHSSMDIVPADQHTINVYDDASSGGNSSSEITDPANWKWHCSVREKFSYPHCGFQIFFDTAQEQGVDLRSFKTIRLWLDYEGPMKTLRVYLRNFDPLYSKRGDPTTTKYNQVEFDTDTLKNRMIEFSINDFFVANWWLMAHNVPPELSHPQFDNIVDIEVETGSLNTLGEHNFHLYKIQLVGQRITTEQWYQMIMLAWLVIFVVFLAYRIFVLSIQVRLQKKRETELLEINSLLDLRSKRLDEKSKTDSLTGAFNRQGIEEALGAGLREWRTQNKPLSLIMMDVDHFKRVNDQHGHAVGDYVLATISQLVKANIRSNDLFARWGGEEFVLVCNDTQVVQAFVIAEKIRAIISEFEFENSMHVTLSFGVATLKTNESLEQLFNSADKALYQAKHEGRNRVVVSEGS